MAVIEYWILNLVLNEVSQAGSARPGQPGPVNPSHPSSQDLDSVYLASELDFIRVANLESRRISIDWIDEG